MFSKLHAQSDSTNANLVLLQATIDQFILPCCASVEWIILMGGRGEFIILKLGPSNLTHVAPSEKEETYLSWVTDEQNSTKQEWSPELKLEMIESDCLRCKLDIDVDEK